MERDSPDLDALRSRLADEERAYAEALDALDALAAFPLPAERLPQLAELMGRLNELWQVPAPPSATGVAGRVDRRVRAALAPVLERQQQFNSALVQALNGHVDESARLHARLRDVVSALIRYLQRVLPTMDARDRMATALATTRSELVLEAFDRRQESLGRRLQGLLALRDRLEAVAEEVRALRGTLSAGAPAPALARAAEDAAEGALYAAFENRFRGSREEIRERLASYLPRLVEQAPVVDLGCGRGELLELLREAGVTARGVESNAHTAADCRARGLDVQDGDLLAFLRAQPEASLGAVFAAQVAEHLKPAVLLAVLREARRALRAGGLLVLETVNPRSVTGLLEVFNRDLTHERPLHPETLSFLVAAAGFGEVRTELRAPVEPASCLQPVPAEGLPPRAAQALDENIARLNALLYGAQEYALFARR